MGWHSSISRALENITHKPSSSVTQPRSLHLIENVARVEMHPVVQVVFDRADAMRCDALIAVDDARRITFHLCTGLKLNLVAVGLPSSKIPRFLLMCRIRD
ncbi:predicted protein [Histoplasma capsulatum H143]|uniref:Uncharacterized protein n=1 Tax=Ajellomyces capsulatus (strain H143) TaxID=544712 RepID=C6HFQ6_AJECH|nr:predicted protein [Histoplasma capsulatum H143]